MSRETLRHSVLAVLILMSPIMEIVIRFYRGGAKKIPKSSRHHHFTLNNIYINNCFQFLSNVLNGH